MVKFRNQFCGRKSWWPNWFILPIAIDFIDCASNRQNFSSKFVKKGSDGKLGLERNGRETAVAVGHKYGGSHRFGLILFSKHFWKNKKIDVIYCVRYIGCNTELLPKGTHS